ncbi:ferredoxin C 2, chloroplastic-like isoform X2 [Primulina eburnea]
MDLQTPCNACLSVKRRRPSRLGPSLNQKFIAMPFNSRRKIIWQLQSLVAVNGSAPSTTVPTHKVTVHDRQREVVHEFFVPEDQYILHTAESQSISLPFACRHGCCTSCAVRVKSGQLRQPEALGISAELKDKGYALLCVGFPSSDLEVETQDEDEVYWLQFGRYFARGPIERDDYALELAMGDE